ncbi:MAG: NAD(P)H-hydrate epimerase [Planctomycetes bacterium]|nr:NAD(P)H-hydrate epimerase [Planctomycetota bacterium]
MRRTAIDVAAAELSSLSPQDSAAARRLDAEAMADLGMPSILLMENAARAVADEARRLLGGGDVLVLAGKGNNGGDGLAMARFLSPHVRVALVDEPTTADAALQLAMLRAAHIPVHVAADAERLTELADRADVIVDALIGTGLWSPPRGAVADWIRWANDAAQSVVAVDLPSGLSADTGEAFDPCIRAGVTVTFARPKLGLLERDGPAHAGRVVVATLGLPEDWVEGRD